MIAMAAAPGFSPLLGSALDSQFGWRISFLVVAAFGVALALHYWTSAGETHPADRRATLTASGFQLGWYFASTVFIVFAAGFLAPRLAHRWGQRAIGAIGISIALAGSLILFGSAAAPALMPFTMAIALYLLGMGLINPLGTAIALHPFGKQAGLASALLGFLQMGCATIGASIASVLPLQPFASLAVILTAGSALALLVFLPVALRQAHAELAA